MAADPETDALHELPPAYQQAIRAEVRDVLSQTGQQVAEQRGWTKREVLKAGGYVAVGALLGGGGLYAGVSPVQAAASGQVGTSANAVSNVFAEAIAAGASADAVGFDSPLTLNHNEISSATTISTAQVVPYDCSAAGFTITLGTELEAQGMWVVLIDETGSSGTNSMTVDTQGAGTTIDGGASITINHDAAITTIYWDGDEFRTTRFIDTVDARQGTFEQVTINDLTAELIKTTDQAISADTDTTVEWDTQNVDTDIYTYDAVNDDIDVLVAGDYDVESHIEWEGLADGDQLQLKIFVNGSLVNRDISHAAAAGIDSSMLAVTLRNLSVNDTIRVDVRSDAANGVNGDAGSGQTYTTITRQG